MSADAIKGTSLGYWTIPIVDAQDDPIDLTYYRVDAKWRIAGGAEKTRADIQRYDPANGIVRFHLLEGDLDDSGDLNLRLMIVDPSTGRIAYSFMVRLSVEENTV